LLPLDLQLRNKADGSGTYAMCQSNRAISRAYCHVHARAAAATWSSSRSLRPRGYGGDANQARAFAKELVSFWYAGFGGDAAGNPDHTDRIRGSPLIWSAKHAVAAPGLPKTAAVKAQFLWSIDPSSTVANSTLR
jgi:hypothetical protein